MASPNMISEKEKLGAASEKSRTLIVQKDDCGYGLTLSGDRPTRVQTVKPGGASHKAGVREGDVIIKVNGQPVTESFHSEVVKLIQNSKYVALTVVHHSCLPLTSSGSALELLKIGSGDPPTGPGPGSEELKRSQSNRNSSTSITNPQPVSEDGQKKLVSEKLYNLKLMVEQENRYIEELRTTHARTNSPKTKKELDKALKNLARLNDQLRQFSPDKPPLATPPTNDIKARLGLPPLPTSPDSTPAAPPRRESISLNPPPLPARNKGFAGSPDAPPPPPRSISSSALPPPPPKLNSRHGSHENVSRAHHRRGSQVGPGANSPVKTPTEGNLPTVIHQRTRSSPCSLEQTLEAQHSWSPSNEKFSLDDRSSSPRYETPPGTPPPPYNDNPSHTPGSNHTPYIELSPTHLVTWDGLLSETNHDGEIMTMDSDDDDEPCDNAGLHLPPEGDHGPFNNLQELLQHAAHLAVFLNYVISNADPSCLLFYLITDAYKLGSAKEMRKWAYEIHSCFLVPHAPVEIPGLDHQVIGNIDTFLAEENSEREEFLLKLFWKARSRARDVLKVQLDDFRATRAAGLGAIFGPNDHELRLCDENVGKRNQVIDDLLVPVLETMSEDLENATDRSSTMASSLATVLSKTFVTNSPVAKSIIDKCPTFVSKEKRKEKFFGRNRKNLTIQGHHFVLKHYDQVTYCNQSQGIIWGIGPQGYQCSNCSFDVHKKFVQKVEETCVGPSSDKKKRNRTSMFHLSRLSDVGRIMSKDQLLEPGRKASGPGSSSVSPSPSMRLPGDVNASVNENSSDATDSTFDLNRINNSDMSNADTSGAEGPFGRSPSILDQLLASSNQNREGRGVKRSESAKDGAKRAQPRHYTRKHSDPNLGPRMSISDSVEMGPSVNSGSSSSSSIPGAVDLRPWDSPHLFMATENVPSVLIAPHTVDSDLEIENDPPDWRLSISIEQLQKLKPKQRKRQDVINELFHTERSHVRNLKVLSNIFRRPLIESGLMPREVVDRLFPNIDDVLTVHQRYNGAMKDRMKRGFPIGNIGDILGDMFMGVAGEHLINVGAKFTKNQKFTIEELKKLRSREGSKLDQLLEGIEKNPVCRKLQLQDLLAVEHQRLVKYPLLLEQIARVTDEDQDEASIVKKSVLRTKEILEVIDKQVAEAQNKQQLVEIQGALDTSGLDKHVGSDHPICLEYKNINLTKHRLIHEGCLTMKLGDTRRIKTIDLYVLLLEDCIMLLQKEGEKFLLKFHMSTAGMMQSRGDDNRKLYHSPIIKFSSMLVRPVATDKRAFYLLNTTQVGPQIYELVASSPGDRKTWFTHIESTAASYKQREARRVGGFKDMDSRSLSGDIKVETGRLSVPEDLDKKAAASPAGRSQSFHEQSVSQRLPAPPSRPQSVPQEQVEVEAETAETVRSKIETLWRKDEEVAKALEEKQRLVADILRIPEEEFEVGESAEAASGQGDAREVLLAVLAQAENLTSLVNQSLKVTEEEGEASATAKEKRFPGPPGDKLIAITTTMNQHLTSLLTIIQDREEERERWRRELARSQEQVRACMVGSSDRMVGSSVTSPMTSCSRPNSYISLESDSERCPDSECDVSNASGGKMEGSFSLDLPQKETTPTNEIPSIEGGGLLVLQTKRNGNESGEELRDVEGVIEDNINNNSGGGESLTLVDVEAGETEDSTC